MRSLLRKPYFWLAAVLVLLLGAVADSFRSPSDQVSAKLYVGLVRLYQGASRPVASKVVRCRYEPTCSEYSIEAVRRFGIRKGLVLTVSRVSRCRKDVPPGTLDPVPAAP